MGDPPTFDEGFNIKVRPWQTNGTPPKRDTSFSAKSGTATGLPSRVILSEFPVHLDLQMFPAIHKDKIECSESVHKYSDN